MPEEGASEDRGRVGEAYDAAAAALRTVGWDADEVCRVMTRLTESTSQLGQTLRETQRQRDEERARLQALAREAERRRRRVRYPFRGQTPGGMWVDEVADVPVPGVVTLEPPAEGRLHSLVTLPNPFLGCDTCHRRVTAWHNPERCPWCLGHGWARLSAGPNWWNAPCGHTDGVSSDCPSWDLRHGCMCVASGWSSRRCVPPPPSRERGELSVATAVGGAEARLRVVTGTWVGESETGESEAGDDGE